MDPRQPLLTRLKRAWAWTAGSARLQSSSRVLRAAATNSHQERVGAKKRAPCSLAGQLLITKPSRGHVNGGSSSKALQALGPGRVGPAHRRRRPTGRPTCTPSSTRARPQAKGQHRARPQAKGQRRQRAGGGGCEARSSIHSFAETPPIMAPRSCHPSVRPLCVPPPLYVHQQG